jgi:hypothetical protein
MSANKTTTQGPARYSTTGKATGVTISPIHGKNPHACTGQDL